jgi:hypothetical protein
MCNNPRQENELQRGSTVRGSIPPQMAASLTKSAVVGATPKTEFTPVFLRSIAPAPASPRGQVRRWKPDISLSNPFLFGQVFQSNGRCFLSFLERLTQVFAKNSFEARGTPSSFMATTNEPARRAISSPTKALPKVCLMLYSRGCPIGYRRAFFPKISTKSVRKGFMDR